MATLKERIQALEAAAGSSQAVKASTDADRPNPSLDATTSKDRTVSREQDFAASADGPPSTYITESAVSPTETALSSIPALRPVKSPSPQPSTPNRPHSSMRPPSLSVSRATPSPARPVATTNHSSPSAVPTTYAIRKPPVVPPKLPTRPSAPSSPAPSSLSANNQGTTGRVTEPRHGHNLSTSSWASVSLSSDGESEASTSRTLAIPPALNKTREHRVVSAPPLPARKGSVSSLASTSASPVARRAPPVAPIANVPAPALPARAPGAVSYSQYQPAARERSRTLPPPLSPSSLLVNKESILPEPTYAVRRKAPQPPPLAPRPSQQQNESSKQSSNGVRYDHLCDAVMICQRDALARGVVLEPRVQGTDSGWKRISAVTGDDKVLASVVRVIWSRSNLDASVLRGVWKSVVESESAGSLTKAQFCKGMTLIDREILKSPAKRVR